MGLTSTTLLESFVADLCDATGMVLVSYGSEADEHLGEQPFDAKVLLTLPIGGNVEVRVRVLGAGYPRDVQLAILQFAKHERSSADGMPIALCVIAPMLSPGARQALKQAGINFYDGSGSMYFKYRTYLVVMEFRTQEKAPRRPAKLFTGARERVIHALLESWRCHEGDGFISGAALAELAETSTYTVSLTMQALEREAWVETTGTGPLQRRRVSDPAGLLDAWAASWAQRRDRTTFWHGYAPRSNLLDGLLPRLQERSRWAFTGAAAANVVVPHLTSVDRVQVIVPPGLAQAWGAEMNLTPVDKGANVVLIERDDASLMFLDEHPERPGSRFASRFVQYLDLLDGYGRNKELAAVYRQKVLHIPVSRP